MRLGVRPVISCEIGTKFRHKSKTNNVLASVLDVVAKNDMEHKMTIPQFRLLPLHKEVRL